jgi:hypothetical protein
MPLTSQSQRTGRFLIQTTMLQQDAGAAGTFVFVFQVKDIFDPEV